MSKTQCKQKNYSAPGGAQFKCKKCNRLASKKSQVCKSGKLK